jgi:hypothetical protein
MKTLGAPLRVFQVGGLRTFGLMLVVCLLATSIMLVSNFILVAPVAWLNPIVNGVVIVVTAGWIGYTLLRIDRLPRITIYQHGIHLHLNTGYAVFQWAEFIACDLNVSRRTLFTLIGDDLHVFADDGDGFVLTPAYQDW